MVLEHKFWSCCKPVTLILRCASPGESISSGNFFLIQIYTLVLDLPLRPNSYLSLLCLSMPWESTFIGQPLSYFLVKFFLLANHISVILPSRSCGSLFYRFCLSTWLFIFYLEHFVCHIGLLHSFSARFVCCLLLLDQGHSFDATTCHHHHIILFHYLSFTVVHHIISSAWLDDQDFILWRFWIVKFWM
jgi:hypothetical protein